jgi:hypothetical protein
MNTELQQSGMSDAEAFHIRDERDEKFEFYSRLLNDLEDAPKLTLIEAIKIVMNKCGDFTIDDIQYLELNNSTYEFFIISYAQLLQAGHDADDLPQFFIDFLFEDFEEFDTGSSAQANEFSFYKAYSNFLISKYYKLEKAS